MEMSQATIAIIKRLYQKIRKVLTNFSWKEIFSLHKKISKQFAYLISILKCQFKKCKELQNSIKQCLQLLSIMLNLIEYSKFGHVLPLFSYLLQKYQKQNSIKIQSNDKNILSKIEVYLKQNKFPYSNLTSITVCQQNILKSIQINQNLLSITKSQIKLNNSQCVGCSEVFVKGFQITNSNSYYPIVVGLPQKQYSQFNLQKYICAVANAGGGVIILGAQEKNNRIEAHGLKFKQQSHVQAKITQIYKIIQLFENKIYAYVQNVIVHTNFAQKNNVHDQFLRFCFRILILPIHQQRKHYIFSNNSGFHQLFEIYELDMYKKPKKIEAKYISKDNCINFYSLAFKYYLDNLKNKKYSFLKVSSHNNIYCQKPLMQYSQIYNKYLQTCEENHENFQENVKQNIQYDDEPRFKYAYTSLLIVGSKNKDKHIKQFSNYLKTRKIMHQIQKPFQNSFKDGSRSIWLFSHAQCSKKVKDNLKDFDKAKAITFISVFKTLQIDRLRLTLEKQQKFEQIFKNRYPQGYDLQQAKLSDKNQMIKNPVFIRFNSFNQAIYAYLVCQTLQVRPFFVKDNTTYKKKTVNYQMQQIDDHQGH